MLHSIKRKNTSQNESQGAWGACVMHWLEGSALVAMLVIGDHFFEGGMGSEPPFIVKAVLVSIPDQPFELLLHVLVDELAFERFGVEHSLLGDHLPVDTR